MKLMNGFDSFGRWVKSFDSKSVYGGMAVGLVKGFYELHKFSISHVFHGVMTGGAIGIGAYASSVIGTVLGATIGKSVDCVIAAQAGKDCLNQAMNLKESGVNPFSGRATVVDEDNYAHYLMQQGARIGHYLGFASGFLLGFYNYNNIENLVFTPKAENVTYVEPKKNIFSTTAEEIAASNSNTIILKSLPAKKYQME